MHIVFIIITKTTTKKNVCDHMCSCFWPLLCPLFSSERGDNARVIRMVDFILDHPCVSFQPFAMRHKFCLQFMGMTVQP